MRLVFLGKAGAGKGTQAKTLAAEAGIPHISTGDIFRAAVKAGTPLGVEAKRYMDLGQLVPDEVTCGLVRDRVGQPDCRTGFILDGFPRTVTQAESLQRDLAAVGLPLTSCVDFAVADDVLFERLTNRRTCRKCGAISNCVTAPSKVSGVCDACGGETYQRDDDRPEAIRTRLADYALKTTPLLAFYAGHHVPVVTLDAARPVSDVAAAVRRAVGRA